MSYGANWTWAVLVLALTSCGEQKVTGIYLSQSKNGVLLLDLIAAPDHHVSGQIKRITMNEEGDIAREASPMSGTVDSGKITLNLTLNGTSEQAAPGTYDGDSINLMLNVNGAGSNFLLKRASTDDFNAATKQLEAAGTALAARRREERHLTALHAQVAKLVEELDLYRLEAQEISRFDLEKYTRTLEECAARRERSFEDYASLPEARRKDPARLSEQKFIRYCDGFLAPTSPIMPVPVRDIIRLGNDIETIAKRCDPAINDEPEASAVYVSRECKPYVDALGTIRSELDPAVTRALRMDDAYSAHMKQTRAMWAKRSQTPAFRSEN